MRLTELFKKRPAPPAGPLTDTGLLASDLWVDQPDAHERIEALARKGEIGAEMAGNLRHFVDRGYLRFSSGLSAGVCDRIQEDVERAWKEKPVDLAWARLGAMRSFALADEAVERKPSYRIADFHSHSEAALEVYLSRAIFDYVERLLGRPAVATQSLYFEFGSQQGLHRDPVFVQTKPASHLVAAWIALEDIGPQCGPLMYVPGSHRLPYYQFEPGQFLYDHARYGPQEAQAMAEFDRRQAEEHGLPTETFTCRRGDVLIWHHSLLHGGTPVADPASTRHSFVVHYSTRDHYKIRRQKIVELIPGPGGETVERPRILETERVLERDGCHGFDNPMRGYDPD